MSSSRKTLQTSFHLMLHVMLNLFQHLRGRSRNKFGMTIAGNWCQCIALIIILILISPLLSFSEDTKDEKKASTPPVYQLLFFRNDGRVWIILPPKTTLLEIFSATGRKKGWVKAYNRHGQVLAIDTNFRGDFEVSTTVKSPSIRKEKLLVTRHDHDSIGIYTPENASFIEIINASNGFDGVIYIRNKKKQILKSQSGLDIKLINFK